MEVKVIKTIARAVRIRLPVGNCRFFASVQTCLSEEEARNFIDEVSQEFRDANHNAWGFKIGSGDSALIKYSDDREPANTAGAPIIQAIEGAGLTNCVVVVTRYFGGVKLGVGGLIRAYRQSAAVVLAEAGVCETEVRVDIFIGRLTYPVLGTVMHELESLKAEIVSVEYTDEVAIHARIYPAAVAGLRVKVTDLTRGQGVVEHGG